MRSVDLRDLDLACGEFDQLVKVTVADRGNETQGREVNREFCFLENTRDGEVVGNRSTPTLADVQTFERRPTNRSRATPSKVFSAIAAERRRHRRIPNTT